MAGVSVMGLEVTYRQFCSLCKGALGEEKFTLLPCLPIPKPGGHWVLFAGDYLCPDCARPVHEALRKRYSELPVSP